MMDADRYPPRPRWARWATAAGASAFVVLVDLTALGVVVTDPGVLGTARDQLVAAGVLTLLGALHVECTRRVERRQLVGSHVLGAPQADLTAVWTFAAAVLLPPALFTLVAIVLCTHLCWRRSGWSGMSLRRLGFATAATVLCCTAAWAVVQLAGAGGIAALPHVGSGPLALALAIGAYAIVDRALVAAAVALASGSGRPGVPQLLGTWGDNVLELAALCLGALTALALAANPWQVLLVLPPLLVLHRAVYVRRLEAVAATDGKTGLLTAAAWHRRAAAELRRAGRGDGSAALLILDLDHFKSVNDDHGHLAGDDVLAAVAGALRAEVREHDVVGRFGGEEFVVLLPGLGREAGAGPYAIAERIRHRIATLAVVTRTPSGALTITGLSASVGGACYPGDGRTVEELLLAADAALSAAKRSGRNAVRIPVPHGGRGSSVAPVSAR